MFKEFCIKTDKLYIKTTISICRHMVPEIYFVEGSTSTCLLTVHSLLSHDWQTTNRKYRQPPLYHTPSTPNRWIFYQASVRAQLIRILFANLKHLQNIFVIISFSIKDCSELVHFSSDSLKSCHKQLTDWNEDFNSCCLILSVRLSSYTNIRYKTTPCPVHSRQNKGTFFWCKNQHLYCPLTSNLHQYFLYR